MRDLMAERAALEFVFRVAQQEKIIARVDATRPRIERRLLLKRLPVLRPLEDADVRLPLPLRRVLLQFLRDHAVVKLRLHRYRRRNEALEKMIHEIRRLRVLPIRRLDRERGLSERGNVAVGELCERDLGQRIQAADFVRSRCCDPCEYRDEKNNALHTPST